MTLATVQGVIVDRYCLTKPGAFKETWHLVIDVIDSAISFSPGDSVGFIPKNLSFDVQAVLELTRHRYDEVVQHPKTGCEMLLGQFLTEEVDLNVVTVDLVLRLCEVAFAKEDQHRLIKLAEQPAALRGYSIQGILRQYASGGVDLIALIPAMRPMRPRLYSISSAPTEGGRRFDLTVTRVSYPGEGELRYGLCSRYLIEEMPVGEPLLRLFIQHSPHFLFPNDPHRPVIMIGSGAGIAPFRAFMQQVHQGIVNPLSCWLFFGGRKRATDFLYEEFWSQLVATGKLRLDTAFSQDQEQKIYVQHRIWEHRHELWRFMKEGAVILVCGDAKTMAKDVDGCLARIISSEENISEEEALKRLRALHREGRYLRDVY